MRQVQLAQKILFKLNFKSLFFFWGGIFRVPKKNKEPPYVY